MEEAIIRFCESLLARLEEEFSENSTDVHISLDMERGALAASDDEGEPFVQCQLEGIVGRIPEEVSAAVFNMLKTCFEERREELEDLPLPKPFDIVYELQGTENEENIITVDSDLIFLDNKLMQGLSDDLDSFWEQLNKE